MTEREFCTAQALRDGREALANARCTLERALDELHRYTTQFEEAESLEHKAKVLNWVINALACNITPNLRLDLIARAQAALAQADAMPHA